VTKKPPGLRFWFRVDMSDEGGCWTWQGATLSRVNRYGVFNDGQKNAVLAHRFAFEDVRGPIPEGYVIDHLCRNKSCVRPDHLDAVPFIVNVQRGVSNGETHHFAKLNPMKVRMIRAEAAAGATVLNLSTKYGVDRAAIYLVVTGRGWKSVV
jgi:hypothetical protein